MITKNLNHNGIRTNKWYIVRFLFIFRVQVKILKMFAIFLEHNVVDTIVLNQVFNSSIILECMEGKAI